MRLSRNRGLWVFLQQLLKGGGHALGVVELTKNERFLLKGSFAFRRFWITVEQMLEIASCTLVLLGFLIGKGALCQSRRHLRMVGKGLQEIAKSIDRLIRLFCLHVTPAEFEGGLGVEFRGESR